MLSRAPVPTQASSASSEADCDIHAVQVVSSIVSTPMKERLEKEIRDDPYLSELSMAATWTATATGAAGPTMSPDLFGVYQELAADDDIGYSYFTPPSMSGPGLDWSAVEKLMHAEEERFEEAVSSLGVRELLDLVSGLQSAMAEEQQRFDALGLQLQRLGAQGGDPEEQRAVSAALCASQLRLARLCTRNMRCFAQQAIQKKEGESRPSGSSSSRTVISSGTKRLREPFRDQGSELSSSPLIRQNLLDISDFDEVEAAFSSMMEDGSSSQEVLSTPFAAPGENHVDNDFDPKDFVVHRNTFMAADDYHSEDSTLAGSSPQPLVREASSDASDDDEGDYHLRYEEDEEEMQQHGGGGSYDSRHHYAYYPEETELEVIPEEDEDHASNSDCSDPMGERSRMTEHDSGVTDEQHSSGSDDDQRHSKRSEDTDSGLHSLPWARECDSSRGSPENSPDTKERHEPKPDPKPEPRQGSRHTSDIPRATVSIQCNGPDSLRNVLSAQYNDASSPRGPELLKGSRLAELIKSFEQVSVVTSNQLPPPSSRTTTTVATLPASPSTATSATVMVTTRPRLAEAVTTVVVNHATVSALHTTNGGLDYATRVPVDPSPDEELLPRSSTLMWDPTDLLRELYRIEMPQLAQGSRDCGTCINREGYLDVMPSNRKKATYWNPWRRRYLRLHDGLLSCLESDKSMKPLVKMQLLGGQVDTLENLMIGVDDRKGHYVAVKCGSAVECQAWLEALQSHCQQDPQRSFVQPIERPLPCNKRVVIVDLGGCSVRAGILMEQPALPTVYFPAVCSTDRTTGQRSFGLDAVKPEVRKNSQLSFPLLPSAKISKYTIDVDGLPELMHKIFRDLGITNPLEYKVQLCVPRSLSLQTQAALAEALLGQVGVGALSVTHQAICALYAYNTSSGVVVDLGARIDILPIADGYIVEGGVSRLPHGAQQLTQQLRQALAQKQLSLFGELELYLVRWVQQQACYVAPDYRTELGACHADPTAYECCLPLGHFFQPPAHHMEARLDLGRFQCPEGLFRPELWGLDCPGLGKLLQRALQECSLDVRRQMARSVFLSGGLSLLPGLPQRLQTELDALTPESLQPKVHASPYRAHMAFLGASTMASTSAFEEVCVTPREWKQKGPASLSRWHL
ncbi:uncharacterized protein LOC144106925 isoform X4 [Amblyomma americanum]